MALAWLARTNLHLRKTEEAEHAARKAIDKARFIALLERAPAAERVLAL